jgi:hypothetical protein
MAPKRRHGLRGGDDGWVAHCFSWGCESKDDSTTIRASTAKAMGHPAFVGVQQLVKHPAEVFDPVRHGFFLYFRHCLQSQSFHLVVTADFSTSRQHFVRYSIQPPEGPRRVRPYPPPVMSPGVSGVTAALQPPWENKPSFLEKVRCARSSAETVYLNEPPQGVGLGAISAFGPAPEVECVTVRFRGAQNAVYLRPRRPPASIVMRKRRVGTTGVDMNASLCIINSAQRSGALLGGASHGARGGMGSSDRPCDRLAFVCAPRRNPSGSGSPHGTSRGEHS